MGECARQRHGRVPSFAPWECRQPATVRPHPLVDGSHHDEDDLGRRQNHLTTRSITYWNQRYDSVQAKQDDDNTPPLALFFTLGAVTQHRWVCSYRSHI